jgi:hypothetical protein
MLQAVQDVALYDRIAVPPLLFGRWAVRRRHGVSDSELQASAYRVLASFEELLAGPSLGLRVVVRGDESDASDEDEDGDSDPDSGLNALLESLQRCRESVVGQSAKTLLRALKARKPEIAVTFEAVQGQVVQRLAEIEKMLILFGAGAEEDARIAMDVIPSPPDLEPGPSVNFEL